MEILLWLDANERWSFASSIAGFARKMRLCNINHEMELPATHLNITDPMRSSTIDFGLCTRQVLDTITFVTSTTYDVNVLGDHQGVLFDIHMDMLLGIYEVEEEVRTRKLAMSDHKAVQKYVSLVKEKFQAHNIFKRAGKLNKQVAYGETDIQGIMH